MIAIGRNQDHGNGNVGHLLFTDGHGKVLEFETKEEALAYLNTEHSKLELTESDWSAADVSLLEGQVYHD